jgi:hypothetical protein
MTRENLAEKIRKTPLKERLQLCREMIGRMCSEGRPPKMTIPINWEDEDVFISITLKDAEEAL